jgi:hypothetical protein
MGLPTNRAWFRKVPSNEYEDGCAGGWVVAFNALSATGMGWVMSDRALSRSKQKIGG